MPMEEKSKFFEILVDFKCAYSYETNYFINNLLIYFILNT